MRLRVRVDILAAAEMTADPELAALAERGEVVIPFGHLRGLDPETTRVILCCAFEREPADGEWRDLAGAGMRELGPS